MPLFAPPQRTMAFARDQKQRRTAIEPLLFIERRFDLCSVWITRKPSEDTRRLSTVIAFWPSNDGRGSAGGAGGSVYPTAFGGEEVDFLGFGREVDLLVRF
jgi:hypothetical protein